MKPVATLSVILVLLAVPATDAASIVVSSTADSGTGSLRDALASAADGDTIDTTGVTGTILLTSGELLVTKSVTILGPGPAVLAVDGNAASRVFHTGPNNVVSISGLTITNGYTNELGGGIYNDSASGGSVTLIISDCNITANQASDGGGIYNQGFFGSARLIVSNCVFSANWGGGIDNIGTGGSAQIVNSIFRGNRDIRGGGIYNEGTLAITNSLISSNSAANILGLDFDGGGGLLNSLTGNATVVNTTFSGNSVKSDNTFASFISNAGGGINNYGTMSLINSTVRNNSVTGQNDFDYTVFGIGGGIFNAGTMTISGATIISNSVSDGGGNIYNYDIGWGATVTLVNSTLGSSDDVNDAFYNPNATLTLLNCTCWRESIVVSGKLYVGSTILAATHFNKSIIGTITSLGYNLSSDDGGGYLNQPTDLINTDPMLGLLQDNGGPTLTHALLCGSPAIDKGWNFTTLVTDQRGLGFTRNFDDPAVANALLADGTDIGAFESQTICNKPPVARCRNVTVSAGSDCMANASTDNGSFAPDGNPITLTQTPPGPYPLGTNRVTLTVTDHNGASDSCSATVTVMDTTPPNLTCPGNISTNIPWCQTSVQVNYLLPSANDNCSATTVNCTPPSGSFFPSGITTVICTATDMSGNTNTCSFTITVMRPDSYDGPVTSFTVVNRNDSGAGSLRQAILDANASAGLNTIEFAPSAYGTILLTSGELPITDCVIINGPGATNLTVDGNAASRVFYIGANTVVSISGLTISHGSTRSDVNCDCGGGIWSYGTLSLSNVTVSGNTSERGGGIYNVGGNLYSVGGLTIANSTLSGNSGGAYGGGIYNVGALAIIKSTLSDNVGSSGGGGIFNIGGSFEITDSTLSGNLVVIGNLGGGIFNHGAAANATVTIANSTLNSTGSSGVFNTGAHAVLKIGNTILSRSAEGFNILNDPGIYSGPGTVTSLGHNLSSDDGGGLLNQPTDLLNTDPMLGPLQDNGGPTFTHALLCGSPAIDAGKNLLSLTTDQRGAGFTRTFDDPLLANAPGGDATDIGAYELQQGACEPLDSDGDGVLDAIDQCPDTIPGEIIDAHGCSIAQLVPCDGPHAGGTWKNHGQYVRAVIQTATDFLKAGRITRRQWSQVVTDAARSKCGWNRRSDHDGDRDWHRQWDCGRDVNWGRDSNRD